MERVADIIAAINAALYSKTPKAGLERIRADLAAKYNGLLDPLLPVVGELDELIENLIMGVE